METRRFTLEPTIDASTPAYTATNEVATAGGYTEQGIRFQRRTGSGSGVAWIDFSDTTWGRSAFTARFMLIYDSSDSNRGLCRIDFGSDKTGRRQFYFRVPTADASNAIIRI